MSIDYVTTTIRLEPELMRRIRLHLREREDAGERISLAELCRRALVEHLDSAGK